MQLARTLDEFKVLLGKLENGNLLEVHLVLAGQFEEQVERAFETAHVDDQRAVIGDHSGFGAQRRFTVGPTLWGHRRLLLALVLTAHAGIILASSPS